LTESPDGQLQPPFKIALKASLTTRVQTVTPYHPDVWTLAARHYLIKALSVRTLKSNVRTVELVHAISIYEA
jgi:hypothetical protein